MLQSIRALRGVAALLVVIYHACDYAKSHGHSTLRESFAIGAFGVDLFFIISGYVMLLSIEKGIASNKTISASKFLIHRIIRIAPIYWIGTTLLYGIYIAQPNRFKIFTADFDSFWRSLLFFPIVRGDAQSTISPILSQGWTLYHELFFYVTLAALIILKLGRRITYFSPLLLVLIAAFGAATINSTHTPWAELAFSPMNVEFSLGCITYLIIDKFGTPKSTPLKIAFLIAPIGYLTTTTDFSKTHEIQRVIQWGIPASLIFFAATSLEASLRKPLEKFGAFFGDPSYSIYIFHGLTFSAIDLLLKKTIGSIPSYIFIAALCTASIVSGNIIYQLIERPLTNRLNLAFKRLSPN